MRKMSCNFILIHMQGIYLTFLFLTTLEVCLSKGRHSICKHHVDLNISRNVTSMYMHKMDKNGFHFVELHKRIFIVFFIAVNLSHIYLTVYG